MGKRDKHSQKRDQSSTTKEKLTPKRNIKNISPLKKEIEKKKTLIGKEKLLQEKASSPLKTILLKKNSIHLKKKEPLKKEDVPTKNKKPSIKKASISPKIKKKINIKEQKIAADKDSQSLRKTQD